MVRIERPILVRLGIAPLRAWRKLYKGIVKRWLKGTTDHLPHRWRINAIYAALRIEHTPVADDCHRVD